MKNRKRIFAIVLFILIGLFVFTFANPREGLEEIKEPGIKEEDKGNGKETDNKEQNTPDEGQTPAGEINNAPVQQVVAINYDNLEKAVKDGEGYSTIKDEELDELLGLLNTELAKGKGILTERNANQATVNNQTNTILNLIKRINDKVKQILDDEANKGEELLINNPIGKNPNGSLQDLLKKLQDAMKKDEPTDNQDKLNLANLIKNLLNQIATLTGELDAINNVTLTLDSSTTGWTNKNVTLTLNGSEADMDLIRGVRFVKNGNCDAVEMLPLVLSEITKTYIAETNGNYKACVTFDHDVVKPFSVTIDKIDTEAPKININYTNYSNHYRKAHARAATVTDDLSGLNLETLKYVWTTNQNIAVNDEAFQIFENSKTVYTPAGVTGTYYFVVIATDNAGNQSVIRTNGFNLDNEAPKNITISSDYENPINKDIVLTVSAEDHGGIAGYQFNDGEWQTENFATFKNNQKVTVRVKDVAGNVSDVVTYEITNIDKTKATINFGSTSGESSRNHSVTLSASDLSGIKQLRYQWLEASEGVKSIDIQTHLENNEEAPLVAEAPSKLNGTYYLWVYAQDNANNGIVANTGPFVFDNENVGPEFTVSGNAANWTNQDVTLTINATYNSDMLADAPYSFDGGLTWGTGVATTYTDNQVVNILVKDKIGNVTEKTVTINKIDKVKPVITFDKLNGEAAENHSVNISATDNNNNVVILKHVWLTDADGVTESQLTNLGENPRNVTSEVTLNGIYYLWVYAKDEAGNDNLQKSGPFIFDNSNENEEEPDLITINNPVYTKTNEENKVNISVTIETFNLIYKLKYFWANNLNQEPNISQLKDKDIKEGKATFEIDNINKNSLPMKLWISVKETETSDAVIYTKEINKSNE
ncbi:MAG: hypothetical protein PHO63_06060 [Bacilli bacterium]|nr:hypothetical protein [Bacilli bacterium]MDD4808649.1 hypothetical protein [Bacilli bacterium]